MNIAQLMKQANHMQKKLNKVQNAFNEKVFDFVSDDGNIQGQMKGNMEIVKLAIDEALLTAENKTKLEDLLVETLNQKRAEIAKQKEEEIGSIAGNVSMPNLF
ncbi:MAG TPA: YbaB/EbfC family nucleoid-associated protein [Candidatus Fimiplasma intestinipullorum]|uniref:Nucleoid-associated protein IAD15_02435 n=1 Tax=Candidatus Fimiplasma intestinipullorum TaxID=2840825 RepID=A0A9D1L0H7_9FIRM|nr:YbaB/EbfC family nucleoid-associated protein [Candidatus Fimiplasma intestinipullorum]